MNSDTTQINLDSSGYVCNNQWHIQGAWYCYTDGSDSTNSCGGSTGGTNVIPYNASSKAMCLTGTMGAGAGKYAGIGFKVNSGPPGTTGFNAWNATTNNIVGFAITLASGSTGKGTNGMVLNLEYPTTGDLDPSTKDAPGVTVPGVGGTSITYNALFSDAVQANNINHAETVDPTTLTDLKVAFFPDSVSHTYDFCITKIVPLTAAPSPEVGTGNYGPAFNNETAQAINGVNGYAVQSAPFALTGNPMTMQVTGGTTSGHVGFTFTPGSGFSTSGSGPGSFPAIVSGWGPGEAGIQFYGPYKGGKTISTLTSVSTTWSFTTGGSGNGDAAYDVWFSNTSADPTVPGIEFMIWINKGGKQSLGCCTAAGTALTVGSNTWTPYVGTNTTNQKVVSYVPATDSSSASIDLLTFFKDAAANGHGYAGIASSSYLLGVQTGFEVYGGSTWTTTDYSISIQ
jgi:hypothetical protein